MKRLGYLSIALAMSFSAFMFTENPAGNGVLAESTFSIINTKARQQEEAKLQTPQRNEKFKWGPEEKADYAAKRLEPTEWDLEMLAQDVEGGGENVWPTSVPIKYLPAPVPKYGPSGGSTMSGQVEMGEQKVVCTSFAYGRLEFNDHLFEPKSKPRSALIYINMLVLTDDPSPKKRSIAFVSRNHPHILSQGRVATCVGNIDWQHTALASGENFVTVNQHFFDLNFGRTILVAPLQDGSLRFMQRRSPRQLMSPDLERNLFQEHIEQLQNDKEVLAFFNQKGAISSETSEAKNGNDDSGQTQSN